VSHDLRAPLRGIEGFGQALMEDAAGLLDEANLGHLKRIVAATGRMGQLIDDMLALAKVSRQELAPWDVDLSGLARQIAGELAAGDPGRSVAFEIQQGLTLRGDPGLTRILLENLMGNAWKFTRGRPDARVEVFAGGGAQGGTVYTVRDNGAGFDMKYVHKLFGAFQRLHAASEFPGTGIGLATVARVVGRHHGRVWAEGKPGEGAAFHFSW
jgi:light-regulated signal transduction histidine kinase (bacteriophytochrome)